jgi:hypothetical protein
MTLETHTLSSEMSFLLTPTPYTPTPTPSARGRLFPFFMLLTICLVAEGTTTARLQATDPLPSIRRQYASINRNLPKYKVVRKKLSGFSAEGGELVAHFDGRSIMKIGATFYGETGKTREEYYYRDGRLIFVFHKEFVYERPLSGKVVRTHENRFYFDNDKLIKWINEDGKDSSTADAEYAEKQDEYLKSSMQFTAGARSRKSTIEAPE